MKRAIVKITPELLAERLMIPAGAVVDGATWDPIDRTIVLSVQDETLPDVPDRHQAPLMIWRSIWL